MNIESKIDKHKAAIKVLEMLKECDVRIENSKKQLRTHYDIWPASIRWKVISKMNITRAAKERLKNRYAKIQTNQS